MHIAHHILLYNIILVIIQYGFYFYTLKSNYFMFIEFFTQCYFLLRIEKSPSHGNYIAFY